MKKLVSIIGNSRCTEDSVNGKLAFEIGKALVDNGYRVMTGGLDGVMKYALKGAKSSANYREGDTVAVLPMFDETQANEYADIIIPTGIDLARDVITANAPVVVAVGGGSGTLGEMANAWTLQRMLIAMETAEGWSAKFANTQSMEVRKYSERFEDKIWGAKTAEDVIKLIKEKSDDYTLKFGKITFEGKKLNGEF